MAWVWLVRDDGRLAHAFDIEGDWRTLPYIAAGCDYTAPSNALHEHTGVAQPCPDCAVAVGRTLREGLDWS